LVRYILYLNMQNPLTLIQLFIYLIMMFAFAQAKEITIIGDSITVGASKYIRYYMPDAVIDAKVGRKFQEAIDRVRILERKGLLKDTVIIALGTNGYFTVEEGLRLIDYLQSRGRQVIFVNVKVPRKWESRVNNTYRELSRLRNVRILNWKAVADNICDARCFRDDGYHLTNIGNYWFVWMIYWYGYR